MKYFKRFLYTAGIGLLLSTSLTADCSYELFSINSAKNTKIVNFIDQLSDQCEFSVIVTDPIAQSHLNTKLNKTHLKNLTINEVLDIILTENNLAYKLENNLLKISYLSTKIFPIDYILSQRKAKGSTDITLSSSSTSTQQNAAQRQGSSQMINNNSQSNSQGNSRNMQNNSGAQTQSGISIKSNDEVIFWKELDLELQRIINRPEDIYKAQAPIINKNAGLVTVTATVKQLTRLEKYLKQLQDKVQLQVLIDVQLLSVTMKEGKTTGVDWQQLYALQNMTLEFGGGSGKKTNTSGSALNPSNYVTIKGGGSLNEVIKFLQTQGDVNSISNPKVLTLNNQPAMITAGTQYFYKIKSQTNQQSPVGGVSSVTQNNLVKSVFAGVLLDITPEISDDEMITLKINPSLSETREDLSQTSSSDRTMPPDLNRRQLSSVVTIKDGNKIILGGLINTKKIRSSNKVPILGDIPGLSYFFRYESTTKQVQELVLVIEPHIIRKGNNNISLTKLGYEGITNGLITLDKKAPLKERKDTDVTPEKISNED